MKSIEIKTTQNVVLQYELADLRDRILAFLIDLLCVMTGISIISVAGFTMMRGNSEYAIIFTVFLYCIFVFYSLVLEVFNNGQSIGKMAMRIQVIKTAGGQATFADYVARWVFRIVDIYFSLGGIASILIASSAKAQRIGDIVANTAVVKIVPNMNLNLKDVLAIHSIDSYKVEYTQAKQLREEDALLIKTTLERYRRFNNTAHQEAVQMLTVKIKDMLGLSAIIPENVKFLQTVLSDYVVLSR